jgi:hypothetical protein
MLDKKLPCRGNSTLWSWPCLPGPGLTSSSTRPSEPAKQPFAITSVLLLLSDMVPSQLGHCRDSIQLQKSLSYPHPCQSSTCREEPTLSPHRLGVPRRRTSIFILSSGLPPPGTQNINSIQLMLPGGDRPCWVLCFLYEAFPQKAHVLKVWAQLVA